MFTELSYTTELLAILYDQIGRGKSKMAVSILEIQVLNFCTQENNEIPSVTHMFRGPAIECCFVCELSYTHFKFGGRHLEVSTSGFFRFGDRVLPLVPFDSWTPKTYV